MSLRFELLTWACPNGRRAAIMLEECGLSYDVTLVDLVAGAQRASDFTTLNPAAAVPVLIDREDPSHPFVLTQSGAILRYLSQRTGHLAPQDDRTAARIDELLMLVLSDVAAAAVATFLSDRFDPAVGTTGMFRDRLRHFATVVEKRLSGSAFLAGDFSIADVAMYPISTLPVFRSVERGCAFPMIERWRHAVAERPAVQRGMAVGAPETRQ